MNKLTTILLLVIIPLLGSCAMMQSFFKGEEGTEAMMITSLSNVMPEMVQEAGVIPEGVIPEEAIEIFGDSIFVLTPESSLIDPSLGFVLIPGEEGFTKEGIWDSIMTVGKVAIPGFAAWEGVLALFSPRKRRHYGTVKKAVLPWNSTTIAEGIKALGKAIGTMHSSTESEKAANDSTFVVSEEMPKKTEPING